MFQSVFNGFSFRQQLVLPSAASDGDMCFFGGEFYIYQSGAWATLASASATFSTIGLSFQVLSSLPLTADAGDMCFYNGKMYIFQSGEWMAITATNNPGSSTTTITPEFNFTASGQLTAVTTAYPTNLSDEPRAVYGLQLISGSWYPTDLVGMVWVSNTYPRYLQGNIDTLSPTVSSPIRIVILGFASQTNIGYATNSTPGFMPWANFENRRYLSTSQTLYKDDFVLVDTSTEAFPLTLPANPVIGWSVTIIDAMRTFPLKNLTLNGNGSTINGQSTAILDAGDCRLFYVGGSVGWRL